MIETLYRFRSTKSLFDFKELEKQEIYFASPEQLNDPMEGFKDIIWSGDEIVWKNFLRHYVLCLTHICSALIICGEEQRLESASIPIFSSVDKLPSPQFSDMFSRICQNVFESEISKKYVKGLAGRGNSIRRNELVFYLSAVHGFLLNLIFSGFKENGLLPEWISINLPIPDFGSSSINFEIINKLEADNPDAKDGAEKIYSANKNATKQIGLINEINNPAWSKKKNLRFVFVDFSDNYVKQLEKLIFPDWYAACFMDSCNNASVWGHYGDSHKGVCLKFKTTAVSESKAIINLHGISGWAGNKEKSGAIWGSRTHELFKMRYVKKFPEIDFFRSMGRLPIPSLNRTWYFDEGGNRSSCGEHISGDMKNWHGQYWERFIECITTKLEDWNYENEFRMVLFSHMIDFDDPSNRKLKYDFGDLEGIIFGINTSDDDKVADSISKCNNWFSSIVAAP